MIEEGNIDDAVYAIGYQVLGRNYVLGSGFAAHFTNSIWTNAHVVEGVIDAIEPISHLNPRPFAVKSGTVIGGSDTYWLSTYRIHRDYDRSTVFTPDVATLQIEAKLTLGASFLPRDRVQQMRAGQPIGTIGFPGELADISTEVPIATFKDGTISALRPFRDGIIATPENSRVIQHNLDLSGGTSGSLIFDHEGFIIGINFAGFEHIVIDVSTGTPNPVRVSSGNIGLGIRVDEMWRHFDLGVVRRTTPGIAGRHASISLEPLPSRDYPHSTYQPFPENWNGETISP